MFISSYSVSGVTILFTSDDCPQGPWRKRILPERTNLDTAVIGEGKNKRHGAFDHFVCLFIVYHLDNGPMELFPPCKLDFSRSEKDNTEEVL